MLILASRSPRRKELLKLITEDFAVIPSSFDERSVKINTPFELVRSLSYNKALAVKQNDSDIIIGCDTVVYLNGDIFGIPQSPQEATSMLKKLSGQTHSVITGVCILHNNEISQFECETKVTFFKLTSSIIKDYVATTEPYDKAGGYGIQGNGTLFVEKIDGDYANVVGLPISALNQFLKHSKKIL